MSGLSMKRGGNLGNISCDWPASVSIGEDCIIQDGADFRIEHPFSANNYIQLGDRVFIGRCCEFNCTSKIIVGNDTMIASNTTIVDVGHHTEKGNNLKSVSEDINIGSEVWIGARCVILKGVSIGNGAIVGAGSVVNKSIPEYEIWAGTPARFIKSRI
jgi:acetyltransferase-like isoleucine patch superfamily enzyme